MTITRLNVIQLIPVRYQSKDFIRKTGHQGTSRWNVYQRMQLYCGRMFRMWNEDWWKKLRIYFLSLLWSQFWWVFSLYTGLWWSAGRRIRIYSSQTNLISILRLQGDGGLGFGKWVSNVGSNWDTCDAFSISLQASLFQKHLLCSHPVANSNYMYRLQASLWRVV